MGNDFDEFFGRIGREVPLYRCCPECDDFVIVDPSTYEKPKTICDPGYCERAVPYCVCKDVVLYDERHMEECKYPDCPRSPPPKDTDTDDC